jgi:hypothetical protein
VNPVPNNFKITKLFQNTKKWAGQGSLAIYEHWSVLVFKHRSYWFWEVTKTEVNSFGVNVKFFPLNFSGTPPPPFILEKNLPATILDEILL